MDRKDHNNQLVLGILLLVIFACMILYGLLSGIYCNSLLIFTGMLFMVWLIFGSPLLMNKQHSSNWVFLILLSLALFIIWVILKLSGVCNIR